MDAPVSSSDPIPEKAAAQAPSASTRKAFAEQELRLISALVLILGAGLFLALPFVLSIGSVVFLPVVTAIVLTIILSPLADKLAGWGLPNILASLVALLTFFAILLLALGLILQPAVDLYDRLPAMANQAAERFGEFQAQFAWLAMANQELAKVMGQTGGREVVLASPSVIQQLAFATPSVVLETLLTLLMTFFMIEARVRMRKHLLFDRTSFGTSIKAARALREMQDRVAAYIFTVAWINGCVGIVVAIGAWAMGVEAPVMWGGLAAMLNFIPYIGPLVMTSLLGLFGIGTAILGARFTMNPVMILIALSYFSWIWGVFGALLSVPILLMLTAFFDNVGRPNLIGFVFGEPLFAENLLDLAGENALPKI